jgi:hypothetical protein
LQSLADFAGAVHTGLVPAGRELLQRGESPCARFGGMLVGGFDSSEVTEDNCALFG